MEDSRLLYDAFNIYYTRGMDALKEKNYDIAKRNILAASETLLKLAKESSGQLRLQRIKRSDELSELAERIDSQKLNTKSGPLASDNGSTEENIASNNVVVKDYSNVTLEEAINSLASLEGLNNVKKQVSDLVDQIKVFKMRKAQGLPTPDMSYHMVFTGNPGTGKTTVARIIGQIYHDLGILSRGHMVEVDRGDLVAGYVGQTAIKTKDVINRAMGGVLFIDEAYTLKKGDDVDFGQEAIDTLNKSMEDQRNDLVVIVAGYENEMKPFIDSNQGLRSRFRTYINFDDYSGEELYNIFLGLLEKNRYCLDGDAADAVKRYLKDRSINQFNGNARDVRNMFENIVKLQSRRVVNMKNPEASDLALITVDDLPFRLNLVEDNCKDEGAPKMPEYEMKVKPLQGNLDYKFDWDLEPSVSFDDIAGLDDVKDIVKTKVLLPLKHPDAFDGYEKKNGGGLFLYGPPGTGKTMIAAAIANEIGAKFCSVKPSDLLHQGAGNTEKAVKQLFEQAREYKCAVIYFDEMDSIAQKNTKSTYSKQLRSELLAQIQGVESYEKGNDNILFLIAATNKPWDVDSAFVRPGRFGTRVYVGLPDDEARRYMVLSRFDKVRSKGIVTIDSDISFDEIVEATNGFNCSDITNLLDRVDEISAVRAVESKQKYICMDDICVALKEISSSVQIDDIEKLMQWRSQNIN